MIEKMFDENFLSKIDNQDYIVHTNFIKEFIFETLIPEVLKSMLKDDDKFNQRYVNDFNKWIKKKAKELYWIDL